MANKNLFGYIPSKFFSLFGTTINGDANNGISAVATVKVEFQNNNIQGALDNIFGCPTIKEVNLQGNKLTSNQQLTKPATALETLNLAQTDQTNLNWLQNNAPNLKSLNLANNNKLDDVSPLATMTKLTTLDLTGTGVTDLSTLTGLTNLKTLTVEPGLSKQKAIIISNDNPASKTNRLMSASMSDIQTMASNNVGRIKALETSWTASKTQVDQLTTQNLALEQRIKILEDKINSIDQVCFAANPGGSGGATTTVGTTTSGMFGGGTASPVGGRRRLTGCGPNKVSGATATICSATATAIVMMFW